MERDNRLIFFYRCRDLFILLHIILYCIVSALIGCDSVPQLGGTQHGIYSMNGNILVR